MAGEYEVGTVESNLLENTYSGYFYEGRVLNGMISTIKFVCST